MYISIYIHIYVYICMYGCCPCFAALLCALRSTRLRFCLADFHFDFRLYTYDIAPPPHPSPPVAISQPVCHALTRVLLAPPASCQSQKSGRI